MTDSDRAGAAGSPDAIPAKTTPTWEMEMLLSGATVFGLMQAPGLLTDAAEPMLARLGADIMPLSRTLVMYAGMAIYALLGTFVLHLLIRALWVAVVGVRSMFPDGPDYSNWRGGPISREVAERGMPDLATLADMLDNRATTCFALGVLTVIGALMPAAFVLPGLLIAMIEPAFAPYWWVLVVVFLGPLMLAHWLDRAFGERIRPGSRFHRALAFVMRTYSMKSMPVFMTAMMNTLTTRLGFRRVMVVFVGALFAVSLIYVLQLVWRSQGAAIGSYRLIPTAEESGHAVLPQHYADQRHEADRVRLLPYIESAVIDGNWLRLTVPYDDRRHAAALRTTCPDVMDRWTAGSDETEAETTIALQEELLDCYAAIIKPALDGEPLPLRPDVQVDAATRIRGLLFMVDVRALAPGRHVIQVARLPRGRVDVQADAPTPAETAAERIKVDAGAKPASYRIPFWK